MHDHIPILFPLESIKEVRKREKLLIHSHYLCSKKCQLMFFVCIMFTLNYHFQLIIHLLLPCSLYLYWYWGFNHDFFFFLKAMLLLRNTHTLRSPSLPCRAATLALWTLSKLLTVWYVKFQQFYTCPTQADWFLSRPQRISAQVLGKENDDKCDKGT